MQNRGWVYGAEGLLLFSPFNGCEWVNRLQMFRSRKYTDDTVRTFFTNQLFHIHQKKKITLEIAMVLQM
jgi:hypothetical protein